MLHQMRQHVLAYLSRSSGYQWLIYLPLLLIVLLLSGLQQYGRMTEQLLQTELQILAQNKENTVLLNKLEILQKSSLSPSSILSNDQIADRFQRWSKQGKAEIETLDFSVEAYDSKLRLTRIKGEFLVHSHDLFRLLDDELGESLFIESVSLRRHDQDRMKLHLQLIQPKAN